MLLVDRLKNTSSLSVSERKCASYILIHPSEVLDMSIHELAEKSYVSSATVVRLCKKMKTQGFGDFKIKLATEINSFTLKHERIKDDFPFEESEGIKDILTNILNLHYQTLADTFNTLDHQQLERIAQLIVQKKSVYLYATGQSLVLAQDFQYKLLRIGIDANCESENGFSTMKATAQPVDSVAMIVSYYGKGKENLYISQILKERKIPTILITGPQTNPLCVNVGEVVHVPPNEQNVQKIATFSSRTAINLVLDFIYAVIFSLDYQDNLKLVDNR